MGKSQGKTPTPAIRGSDPTGKPSYGLGINVGSSTWSMLAICLQLVVLRDVDLSCGTSRGGRNKF